MEEYEEGRDDLENLAIALHTAVENELRSNYNMMFGNYRDVHNAYGDQVVSSVELSELFLDVFDLQMSFVSADAIFRTEVSRMVGAELKAHIVFLNELKAKIRSLAINFMDIYYNLKREEIHRLATQRDMLALEYDYLILRYRQFYHNDPLAATFWKLISEIRSFVIDNSLNAPRPETIFSSDYENHRMAILYLQTNIATFKLFEKGVINIEFVRKLWKPYGPSLDDILNPLCIQFHEIDPMLLASEETPKPEDQQSAKKATFPEKPTIVDLPLGLDIEEDEISKKLLYLSPNTRRRVRNVLATRTHIQRLLGVLKDKKVKRLSHRGRVYRGRGRPVVVIKPPPPPPTERAGKTLTKVLERRKKHLDNQRAAEAKRMKKLSRRGKPKPAIIPPAPPQPTERAQKALDDLLKAKKEALEKQRAADALRIQNASRRGKARPAIIPPPTPQPTERAQKALDDLLKTKRKLLDKHRASELQRIQQTSRRGKPKPAVIPPAPPQPTERAQKALDDLLKTKKELLEKKRASEGRHTSRRGKAKPAIIPPAPPQPTERAQKTLDDFLKTKTTLLDKKRASEARQTSRRGKAKPAIIPPAPPQATERAQKTLDDFLKTRKVILDKRASEDLLKTRKVILDKRASETKRIQQTSRRGKAKPAIIPPAPPQPTERAQKTLDDLLKTRKDILDNKRAVEAKRIQQTSRRGKAKPAIIPPAPPQPTARAQRALENFLRTRKAILDKHRVAASQRIKLTSRRGKARPAIIRPPPPPPTKSFVNTQKLYKERMARFEEKQRAAKAQLIARTYSRPQVQKVRPRVASSVPPKLPRFVKQPTGAIGSVKLKPRKSSSREPNIEHLFSSSRSRRHRLPKPDLKSVQAPSAALPVLPETISGELFLPPPRDPRPRRQRTPGTSQHKTPRETRPLMSPTTPFDLGVPYEFLQNYSSDELYKLGFSPETIAAIEAAKSPMEMPGEVSPSTPLFGLGVSPETAAAIEAAKSPGEISDAVSPSTLAILGYSPRTIAAIEAARSPKTKPRQVTPSPPAGAYGITASPGMKAAIEAAKNIDEMETGTPVVRQTSRYRQDYVFEPAFRDQNRQIDYQRQLKDLRRQRQHVNVHDYFDRSRIPLRESPELFPPRRESGYFDRSSSPLRESSEHHPTPREKRTFIPPTPLSPNAVAAYKRMLTDTVSPPVHGTNEMSLNEREIALYEQLHEPDNLQAGEGITVNLGISGEFQAETSSRSPSRRSPGASPY